MKFLSRCCILVFGFFLLQADAQAQSQYRANDYRQQLLRCESNDRDTKYCDVDTRDGVRIARQLSKTQCIEGQNWGYDDLGIWVAGGCRAEFEVGYGRQYGWEQGGRGGNIVRCESSGSREQYCPADTRFGVQLSRQISSTRCVEGQNWGADSRGIWVRNGCRAEFEVGGRGWDNQQFKVVRCESQDNRQKYCELDGRYNRVRLIKQLSRSQCIQGQTWGSDQRGIWVTNGCRGTFEVSRTYGQAQGTIMRCDSNSSRTQYCDVDTRGGVRLVRQLSESRCIQGQTWGWDYRGIWVTRGCRAEFEVGGGVGGGYNPGQGPGYGYNNGQLINCESNDERYVFCPLNSAYVREVRIERQLSKKQCRQNQNWGVRSDGIWVNGGCRAQFRVY